LVEKNTLYYIFILFNSEFPNQVTAYRFLIISDLTEKRRPKDQLNLALDLEL